MTISDPIQRWAALFEGHRDQLFDLPPEILQLRDSVTRIDDRIAAAQASRPNPGAVELDVIAAAKAAATGSKKAWPDGSAIREARTAAADTDAMLVVLDQARTELASELGRLIQDSAEPIISDCLRPHHDRLVKQFTEAARLLPDPVSTDLLLRAPDATRKAWLDLDEAATAYDRIRDIAARLGRLTPVAHDTSGEFSWMRNLREVWPEWQVGRTKPWASSDHRLPMLWMARHGADLWLPTTAERDALWWERHGAEVERHRHHRQQLGALGALVGGQ